MKFVLTGGGTGGHAYPSVAVAERLRERADVELFYYGTPR
ncbi:MAG: glycosyltransferase, partial [Chloroflexota bacterium]|nr:glycosyltransferase [Chloroflexota bacterium]